MASSNDYTQWTTDELKRAEATAARFLAEHNLEIYETFRTQWRVLGALIENLKAPNLLMDDRVNCFAQISEIARAMEENAEGFFDLSSQPAIARLLASAK
jgi:hypothetical protein